MGALVTALDDALWPRAALPRRPMLGAVLDALTVPSATWAPPSWALDAVSCGAQVTPDGVAIGSMGRTTHTFPWVTTDPAEAYELLQARGLIPMDYRSRFVCEACGGSGAVAVRELGPGWNAACAYCDDGHRPHPPTVAALASWASLGWEVGDDGSPGIFGAEELAATTSPDAPVCWHVAQPGADAGRAYMSGSPARRLLDAGFGWWRRPTHTALVVMPLGLVS